MNMKLVTWSKHVKHVYNDHAYNEMTRITKHLEFYVFYKFYAYSEIAYNEMTLLVLVFFYTSNILNIIKTRCS